MMKRIISLMAVFAALVIVNMQMAEAYSVVDYFAGGSSYSLAADSDYIYSQSGKFNNDGTYAAAGAIPGGNSFGAGYSEWGDTFYRASGKNIMGYNKSTGLLTSTLNTSGLMYHTIHGLTTDGTDFYTSQFYGYGATSNVEIWKINGSTGASSLFFDFGTLPTTSKTGSSATTTGYIEDVAWVNGSIYGIDGAIANGSGSSKLWKIDGAATGFWGQGTFDDFEDSPAGLHVEGIDWDGSAFWVHSNWTPVDKDENLTGDPQGHYYQKLGNFTKIVDPGGTTVPEPAVMIFLGLGLMGLGFYRRRAV